MLTNRVMFYSEAVNTSQLPTTQRTVQTVRDVGGGAYVLRFDRGDLEFEPGQYLSVGAAGEIHRREYSVYSSPNERDFLEILIKEVDGGHVSRMLRRLREGETVQVDGPFGFFTLPDDYRARRFVFVATGTGISPFHCFAGTLPDLEYTLIHGVRRLAERYEYRTFPRERYVSCVTRETGGDFQGRVTDYLRASRVDTQSHYYLCGNCDMVYEVFDILHEAGVPHNQLFAEVYF